MADEKGEGSWRDTNFVANMIRLRTAAGLSQADLVQKLRTAPPGVRWTDVHQTTISRIEKGERQVRFSEAFYIAYALDADAMEMTVTPHQLDAERGVTVSIERVAAGYTTIVQGVYNLDLGRRSLRQELQKLEAMIAKRATPADKEAVRLHSIYTLAEGYLALRVAAAVEAGRAAVNDERVNSLSDVETIYGISEHAYRPDSLRQEDIDAPDA